MGRRSMIASELRRRSSLIGVAGSLAAAGFTFFVVLFAPDGGPSLAALAQAVGFGAALAAPGVATAMSRFDPDVQAVMGGALAVASLPVGLGGNALLPLWFGAGVLLVATARGPLRRSLAALAIGLVLASVLEVASLVLAFLGGWGGSAGAVVTAAVMVVGSTGQRRAAGG